jgi:HD-GYP domain-containing protein (c-di-GMP phosphodiesterase class II)/CHASE1-domain containing sensor protein
MGSRSSQISTPWRRYLPALLAIGGGLVLSLAIFFVVRWWESRGVQAAFRLAAEDRASAVKGTFATEVAMLELVRSALAGAGRLQPDEYRELLAPFLSRTHSIQAVEWVPRVPDSRRSEYEAAARHDVPEAPQITELGNDGKLVRAARRREYFPVCLIGPQPGDKTVFGFDVASEPVRLDALRQARDSGQSVASGRMAFIQNMEEQDGFLLILPVYERGKPAEGLEDRRANLRGFVLGVFRPGDMIESALAQIQPEGIDVCLYDPAVPADGSPFHFHSSRTRKHPWDREGEHALYDPQDMHHVARLNVAGHPWTVVCVPTADFAAARRTWWPWGVLATGLAFTAMLAAYLRLSIDRREQVEQSLDAKRRLSHWLKEKVREQTKDIRRAQEEVIYRLVSASQWRDEETGMHIRRSGLLSELLAKAAGWSAAEAEVIRQAAPMHDVGKIGIPDAILRKPGKLTPKEFAVMKTHTLIGAEMLAGSNVPVLQMAREIALNHHERWDGRGYPAGKAGQDIPESARIVAIVDVYDALTHDRVYRPALPEDEVTDILQQGAGTHFDPLLLAHFFVNLAAIRDLAQEHPDGPREGEVTGHSYPPLWLEQLQLSPTFPLPQ